MRIAPLVCPSSPLKVLDGYVKRFAEGESQAARLLCDSCAAAEELLGLGWGYSVNSDALGLLPIGTVPKENVNTFVG
ncbi:MAG: hypothetical protein KAV00_11990 [Phycisphaerae bacterium]|nr:hypothetical protein [Phycisphaerae bacterium]